jgi:rod shape-determining protein MreB and related proteins
MAKRIAIDLGTTNVLVYIPKGGIVVNEPSVVAMQVKDNQIVAIGEEARKMIGRTPESIIAAYPLQNGVIANYNISEAMLKHFINKVSGRIRFTRPEVMMAVPVGVTSTEKRAVIDATISAGAKQAYLIKGPIAAALGAGIPIATASGNMIIDIGGGTTEVAVVSLGDVVSASSVRTGGNKIDLAISSYIRKKQNLIIGEQTAEEIKKRIGSAVEPNKELKMEASGSNAITGLPESIIITSTDIVKAAKQPLLEIINAVKSVLQQTPPELASDVMDKGIIMTGGGALLRNLDTLMTKITGVPCQVADEPATCAVKGAGIAVEHLAAYKKSVLWAKE